MSAQAVQEQSSCLGSPHQLHQLPPSLIVAIFDCLEDAGEVLRAASVCKAVWHTVQHAHFCKVAAICIRCFHAELQHRLPQLALQFPAVRSLNLSSCSALPESWLQPMAELLWLRDLDVTQLWHWTGGVCLHSWASTLTRLVANDTSFPLLDVVKKQGKPAAATAGTVLAEGEEDVDNSDSPGVSAVDYGSDHRNQPQQQGQLQMQHLPQVTASHALATTGTVLQPSTVACSTLKPSEAAAAAATGRQQKQQQHSSIAIPASRTYNQQQQNEPDGWLHKLRSLRELHLSGLVRHPIRCKTHGSSECDCEEDTILFTLLTNNPLLTHLNLSNNPRLPDRLLHWALTGNALSLRTLDLSSCDLIRPGYLGLCCCDLEWLDLSGTATGDADVAMIAAKLTSLRHLNLRGCRQVSSAGLSHLASAAAVVTGRLRYLNIGTLTRTSTAALVQLITSWTAAVRSSSSRSRLRKSQSPAGYRGCPATTAAAAAAAAVGGCWICIPDIHLGLSYTAGVSDAVLDVVATAAAAAAGSDHQAAHCQQLDAECIASESAGAATAADSVDTSLEEYLNAVLELDDRSDNAALQTPAAAAAQSPTGPTSRLPGIRLSGLELAGCNSVSGIMLQHLASLGVLSNLRVLDVSDVEDLKSPRTLSPVTGTAAAAAAAASVPNAVTAAAPCTSHTVLGQIFRHTGSQMTSLMLDGCYVDDITAGFIGAQCPDLHSLSVVGCKGLHSSGLRALVSSSSSSRGLECLAVGGSSSAWKEADALCGLTSLTELKLVRRSCVTDTELASILMANAGLQRLALVGCYSLTDRLFDIAAAGSSGAGWRQQQQQGLQQLTHLSLTACDGMRGSSIARLRGLRKLRVSFCTAISIKAIQRLVVSCTNLTLLELPAQLQRQLSAFDFSAAAAQAGGSGSVRFGQAGRGSSSISKGSTARFDAVLLPRQGPGGHLHGIKVVCI